MTKRKQAEIPETVLSLKEKVNLWRERGESRRMPKVLWSEAIRLAEEYGAHPVSKSAGISYSKLKGFIDKKNPPKPKAVQTQAQFVEVPFVQAASSKLQIELSRADGCKMVLKDVDEAAALKLTASFFR